MKQYEQTLQSDKRVFNRAFLPPSPKIKKTENKKNTDQFLIAMTHMQIQAYKGVLSV